MMNKIPSGPQKLKTRKKHRLIPGLSALVLALCLGLSAPLSVFATEAAETEEAAAGETAQETAADTAQETAAAGETAADTAQETAADGASQTVPEVSDEVMTSDAPSPWIEGDAGFLMEANTGRVLYEYQSDSRMYPASTTKILTALLVVEHCTDYNDVITFSWNAVNNISWDSSKINASEGEEMTVEQVMYGLFLRSGNDAAMALAEYVAGDVDTFADMMNARAAELGCTGSHFVNPHGLYDPDHYTTAHDLALILREAVKHPEFIQFASSNYYYIESTNKNPDGYVWYTSNQLLNDSYNNYDDRVIASKTGYTDEARNCLVTAAQVGDTVMISTVMHCSGTHYTDTERLLNYGFDNFTAYNMSGSGAAGSLFAANPMFGTWRQSVGTSSLNVTATDAYVLLPSSAGADEIQTSIMLDTSDPSDGVIGTLVYSWNGETVGTSDMIFSASDLGSPEAVIAAMQAETAEEAESVDKLPAGTDTASESTSFFSEHSRLIKLIAIIAAIAVIVILAAVVIPSIVRRRRRHSRGRQYDDRLDGMQSFERSHDRGEYANDPSRRYYSDEDEYDVYGAYEEYDNYDGYEDDHVRPQVPRSAGRAQSSDYAQQTRGSGRAQSSGHSQSSRSAAYPQDSGRSQSSRSAANAQDSGRSQASQSAGGAHSGGRRGPSDTQGLSSDIINERINRRTHRNH